MPSAATDPQPPALRRHQAEALAAIEAAWAEGRRRTWVVLPPGAGKTRLGLEAVLRHEGAAVVLGPNTAIQSQWEAQAAELGIEAGSDRALHTRLTSLTYQSLAVFDPDAEVDDEGAEDGSLLARLHPNGQALVETLRTAGPILVVLDECHHLLEVWGRLLAELLDQLGGATVLGLTATPPAALSGEQGALVESLFGATVYEATIPAAVREGDLAPFAELAWLTTPTATEREWLAGQAERFTELVTRLTDPAFGTIGFLAWLDQRFVHTEVDWSTLLRTEPELCDAALRMHHHGLMELPTGARTGEEHRHPPEADDWMLLLDDWISRHLLRTGDPADDEVVAAIRRVLPSVGHVWTRAGIRAGRTPVDRVLARSAAKAGAAVEIVRTEHATLGDRMRTLVLCDHERAGPTLSADLEGVLDPQSGAAREMLARLVADPDLVTLRPLLVTGRTVAGDPDGVRELRDFVAEADPQRARDLTIRADTDGTAVLEGPWTSRTWLPLVTRFFQSGRSRVLVGTRGLLGEGWDAGRVTALVDLTAVTTTTAVVQARGRALRLDPQWPGKVAVNWSVVCVAEDHPKGMGDWGRLVRKHRGFLGVDERGEVIDGVAHIDPGFSPFAPPATETFDAVNARMIVRAQQRDRYADLWRVGTPYDDAMSRAAWVRPRTASSAGAPASAGTPAVRTGGPVPPAVVAGDGVLEVRRDAGAAAGGSRDTGSGGGGTEGGPASVLRRYWWPLSVVVLGLLVALLGWRGLDPMVWILLGLAVAAGLGLVGRRRVRTGRDRLAGAAERPGIERVAGAVADALHACGLVPVGAEAVRVDIDADGTYRCWLGEVTEDESAVFATALEEALQPIGQPRYVLPRWVVGPPPYPIGPALRAAGGRYRPAGVVWHPVPAALGVRRELADAYAAAWRHWVGGGDPVYTRSPEGAGILAAQQGADPFEVGTVQRRHWH